MDLTFLQAKNNQPKPIKQNKKDNTCYLCKQLGEDNLKTSKECKHFNK